MDSKVTKTSTIGEAEARPAWSKTRREGGERMGRDLVGMVTMKRRTRGKGGKVGMMRTGRQGESRDGREDKGVQGGVKKNYRDKFEPNLLPSPCWGC
jgi:hypothetical protein